MPKQELFELRPAGWESDPADEYFKLTTLDYLPGQVYTSWALFFRLSDADKPAVVSTLRRGLEITLSQCRQLCGIVEQHPDGGLCMHKKRDSTVQFYVQWLDSPEDADKFPSFDDLEQRHFVSQSLGDLDTWCVQPMTYGEKPEAQPGSNPKVAAFKASFIRGGLVFMMHHHHYGNDIMGWAGEMHQLAENCQAIWKNPGSPSLPPWDPANLDLSRFIHPDPPEDQLIDGPPVPLRHPDHKPAQWLLFHLPKPKIAELKSLASPPDNSYWISSYDAYTAYMWRILTKHRAAIFHPSDSDPLIWGEAIELRRRFTRPAPMSPRTQTNLVLGALSSQPLPSVTDLPPMTVGEVISTAPLSKLAWYIRQLTNSVTQESVEGMLEFLSKIRDKTTLFLRTDGLPPLSNVVTEWRDTKPSEADFGFGQPSAFRAPFDTVTNGLILVYPPRTVDPPAGDDEGVEVCIGFEKQLTRGLVEDPEWNRYFEFRGVDFGA